jgi:V8-like Glu-specific endopeptidase
MVSLRSLASSLTLLALAHSATFSSTQAIEPAATIGRDQAVSYAVNATARQPWTQTISVAGAKYLSVHFSQFRLADGDVVTLTDASGAVTAQYSGLGRGDLGDKGGFYSTQIYSSKVTVQYTPSAVTPVGGDYGFAIDKVVRSASSGTVSSVCGTSQLEPPKCFVSDARVPSAYTKSLAVARLTFGLSTCTGWLVGNEGHLLTNFHCIASQDQASNTQYEFGAESPTCDDQCLTLGSCRGTVVATTATFLGGDQKLDYALVKLNASAAALAPYGFLTLRTAGGVNQEQIYIPQHPGGRAKSLAVTVDSGAVARATVGVSSGCGSYRVVYDADTERGSSGSPVLAASDNAVIALHSCGTADSGDCTNSGLDVRTLISDLRAKNIVPGGALDDPNAVIPNGPWIPTTPAPTTPGPVTPIDICPGFRSVTSCEVFTKGKCKWTNGACVKNPDLVAAPVTQTSTLRRVRRA